MPIIRSEYYDLLNEKIAKFKPIIPQGGPITEVLGPTPKQLHPGWIIDSKPDTNIIEQKISYCKRCNIQNEYMKFNPDWTCLSCRS